MKNFQKQKQKPSTFLRAKIKTFNLQKINKNLQFLKKKEQEPSISLRVRAKARTFNLFKSKSKSKNLQPLKEQEQKPSISKSKNKTLQFF
jgi:hypothetical protein